MKLIYHLLFTLVVLIITTITIQAQPGLPSAPSQAPLDGGLSILAIVGVFLGIKKLRNRSKN